MATNYPGSLDTGSEQPSPSASTELDDAGYEHDVVHTNHSGAIIALETKLGTGSSTAAANSVLAGTGAGTSAWTTGTLANDISGNAATATELETARTINGTSFNGTANITVTAAAGTLTGSTLNSGVTASSLTSVGTLTGLTLSGAIDGPQNFTVGNGEGEFVLFQGSSNQVFVQSNGTYRAYWNSSGHYLPYADSTYEIGASALRWKKAWFDTVDIADDLYIGANGRGDSWSHFYDDNSNTWRTFGWDDSANSFYFEGNIQVANGTSGAPSLSFSSDSNTGFYRVSNGVIGVSCNGTLHQFKTDGLHLASGDWFRSYGSAGWYSQTYGGGWYMTDSSWLRAYGNKGISTGGTYAGVNLSTTSGSGFNYLFRNSTYSTFYYYTSTRELKENIVNVDAADAGTWIDALQPVTFIEKWLKDEEEPEDHKTWREADVQTGFIAEDVLSNPLTSRFAQVVDDDEGGLRATGWKWECVIATCVAELKASRAREAALEARVAALEAA